mgnify:CR=1 FL=1
MRENCIANSRMGSTIVLDLMEQRLTSEKVTQKLRKSLFPSSHGFSDEELYLIKSYCALYKLWCEIKDHIIIIRNDNGFVNGYLNPNDGWSVTITQMDKIGYRKLTSVRDIIVNALECFKRGTLKQYTDKDFNPKVYNQYSLFNATV